MRKQTNLVRRGGVYYFRARKPGAYRGSGPKETWRSLRTTDFHVACDRLARVKAGLDLYPLGADAPPNGLERARIAPTGQLLPGHRLTAEALSGPLTKQANFEIEAAITYWAQQSPKRPRTIMDARSALGRVARVLKVEDLTTVDEQGAIAIKDDLLNSGLAFATVEKHLLLLKAVFGTAAANRKIPSNPFAAIKIKAPKVQQKPRIAFAPDDLQQIFSGPVHRDGLRPRGGAGEASFWLPLIALCTGMRLEEIGQLLVRDFVEEAGTLVIYVRQDDSMGQRLKAQSSARRVPAHPFLLKLGLKEYLGGLASGPLTCAFPAIQSAGDRQRTASWSQWFGRYLRNDLGVADRRLTFHSFRHTFKDLCRAAGVHREVHDRLTGHAGSSVGDGYGAEFFPLLPLIDAINRLDVSVLDCVNAVATPPERLYKDPTF